jgi:serine-type D-Ala-D-Ala carboxypeptidase/endopeptidase
VGVADRNGQVFASAGMTRSGAGSQKITEKTVFEIGSITKTFTALLYQMALDGGVIQLNHSVQDLLPPGLDLGAQVGCISLHQLATHHSGMPRMPDNFKPADRKNPYADYSKDQFYDWLRSAKLGQPKFGYSNAGMGLLGHLLELKSGSRYESLIHQWIGVPLSLHDTKISLSAEQKSRSATPHSEGATLPMWDIPTLAGAGALRSTTSDLLRWTSLHAGIIDGPLQSAMQRVQKTQGPAGQGGEKVAIGWLIKPASRGSIIWHSGGTGGTRSWTGFNRRTGTAVVVLANSSVVVDDIGLHLLDSTSPLRTPRRWVPVAASGLKRYAGVYQFGKSQLSVKPDGNRLMVQTTGQNPNPAYCEGNLSFFLRAVDAQLTFEEGPEGQINAVVLHQNGKSQRGERLIQKTQ